MTYTWLEVELIILAEESVINPFAVIIISTHEPVNLSSPV